MKGFTYFKEIAKKGKDGKIFILPDYSDLKEGSYDLLGNNGKVYEDAYFTREYNNNRNDLSVGCLFVCHPASVEIVAYREREV